MRSFALSSVVGLATLEAVLVALIMTGAVLYVQDYDAPADARFRAVIR